MRLENTIFIFTLIFLITLSGCQRIDKQTVDQDNPSDISLSDKNTSVKEKEEENLEVETNLIILPPGIKREEFLKEVQNDEVSKKNDKLLMEKYKQFNGKVIELTVNENRAYVVIQGDGFWRFEKTEDGVWKFGWLARQ